MDIFIIAILIVAAVILFLVELFIIPGISNLFQSPARRFSAVGDQSTLIRPDRKMGARTFRLEGLASLRVKKLPLRPNCLLAVCRKPDTGFQTNYAGSLNLL